MASDSGTLTAVGIKTAKPGKHFDGGGLFLHVQEGGGTSKDDDGMADYLDALRHGGKVIAIKRKAG